MTTYISPNKTMRITNEVSGGYSIEMTIPSKARIRNAELQEVLKDCLTFKKLQENAAMDVLSSFWWMFNKSWEEQNNTAAYGSADYVFIFDYNWQVFMKDLEGKNDELHSMLSKLTEEQINAMAGK